MASLFPSLISCHILLFLLIALFVCLTPVDSKQANSVRRLGNDIDDASKAQANFANMLQGVADSAVKTSKTIAENEASLNSSFSLYDTFPSHFSIFLSPSFFLCLVSIVLSVVSV
eukprot:GHVS01094834.1.p1 GENE.GHVS01094834.1~~GHVS01094834.1.p1  ORF type:complete len:115 (+),score=17.39 GHVS01094834.1:127-471(+)